MNSYKFKIINILLLNLLWISFSFSNSYYLAPISKWSEIAQPSSQTENIGDFSLFKNDKLLIEYNETFTLSEAVLFKMREFYLPKNSQYLNAILDFIKRNSGKSLVLADHLLSALDNSHDTTELYMATIKDNNEIKILAIQMVEYDLEEMPVLSTWVKAGESKFSANQILAYTLTSLLKRGYNAVDSSGVNYSNAVADLSREKKLTAIQINSFVNRHVALLMERLSSTPTATEALDEILKDNNIIPNQIENREFFLRHLISA